MLISFLCCPVDKIPVHPFVLKKKLPIVRSEVQAFQKLSGTLNAQAGLSLGALCRGAGGILCEFVNSPHSQALESSYPWQSLGLPADYCDHGTSESPD